MTDIPQARQILIEARKQAFTMHPGDMRDRIQDALDLMTRKPSKRRAPVRARKITPEIIQAVKRTLWNNPSMSLQQVGDIHGINSGRVSEILNELRDEKTGEMK